VANLDRDYLRFRNEVVPFERKPSWRKRLAIAAVVVGLLGAAVLFIRNTANLANDYVPTPGSLIVNINTATEAELQTIPGIGPTRAAQIVAARPYESVDDLVTIVGIGDESLEDPRPFVTTEGETKKR
jgi:competence ComEA-like helix-hairpin-helix protein